MAPSRAPCEWNILAQFYVDRKNNKMQERRENPVARAHSTIVCAFADQ